MISLYTATVPAMRQMVVAVSALVAKAEAFAAERGIAPAALLEARLAPDMNDFSYQVKSVAVHSIGALDGVASGLFMPDQSVPPADFAGLNARLAKTEARLAAVDPAAIDALFGRDMVFGFGERRVPYLAEDFLLSFTLPNLYFHAATAYDVLRAQGVPLNKGNYLGRPRIKA